MSNEQKIVDVRVIRANHVGRDLIAVSSERMEATRKPSPWCHYYQSIWRITSLKRTVVTLLALWIRMHYREAQDQCLPAGKALTRLVED